MTIPPFPVKNATAIGQVLPAPPQLATRASGSTDDARRACRRAKLWELNEKYHCPVIGTCLPISELAKIAHRFYSLVDLRDEFAMHAEAVGYASSRNGVSEAIQKYLERKYRTQLICFDQAKSDADVLTAWREHFANGEVAGALWATITHKAVSATTQQKVFTDVHMLSHQIGSGQAATTRRIAKLEKDCATARSELDKQKKHQARNEGSLRLQLLKATKERDRLRLAGDGGEKLKARLNAFESGSAMIEMGEKLMTLQAANDELMFAAQRSWALEKALKVAHQETQALASERDRLAAERDALEQLLLAGEQAPSPEQDCAGQCASCDAALRSQCVLYVGGRSSLLAQYRALAQRLGIRLIHHDGGIEESLSRLPDMINGADAVMCPTDCVSHSAYYQLKRQCKRVGKPCLLFKGAGVSGFALALARLSAGQCSVAGMSANPS